MDQIKTDNCSISSCSLLAGLFLFLIAMALPTSAAAIGLGVALASVGCCFWCCVIMQSESDDVGPIRSVVSTGLMTMIALVCIGYQYTYRYDRFGLVVKSVSELSSLTPEKTTVIFSTNNGQIVGLLPYWKTSIGSMPSVGTPFTRVWAIPVVDNAVEFMKNRQSYVVNAWMVNFQGGLTFNDSAQFQYSKFLDAMNLISFNKTASIVDPAAEPVDLYYAAIREAAAYHNLRVPSTSREIVLLHPSTNFSQYSYYLKMFMGSGIAFLILWCLMCSGFMITEECNFWPSVRWMLPCFGRDADSLSDLCRSNDGDSWKSSAPQPQPTAVVIVAGPTSSDIEMSSNAASPPLPPTVTAEAIRQNPLYYATGSRQHRKQRANDDIYDSSDEEDAVIVDPTDHVVSPPPMYREESVPVKPPGFDDPPGASVSSSPAPPPPSF